MKKIHIIGGQNTNSGLAKFDLPNGQYLYVVMLDKHGPNIVFNKNTDPVAVIKFIDDNFYLHLRTDDVDPVYAQKFSYVQA